MCEGPEPDPGKLFGEVHVLKICRWTLGTLKKLLKLLDMSTASPLVPLGCCYGIVVLVVVQLECLYNLSAIHVWVCPSMFGGLQTQKCPL